MDVHGVVVLYKIRCCPNICQAGLRKTIKTSDRITDPIRPGYLGTDLVLWLLKTSVPVCPAEFTVPDIFYHKHTKFLTTGNEISTPPMVGEIIYKSHQAATNTWGVQVIRYPNFFLGEWKQIET